MWYIAPATKRGTEEVGYVLVNVGSEGVAQKTLRGPASHKLEITYSKVMRMPSVMDRDEIMLQAETILDGVYWLADPHGGQRILSQEKGAMYQRYHRGQLREMAETYKRQHEGGHNA